MRLERHNADYHVGDAAFELAMDQINSMSPPELVSYAKEAIYREWRQRAQQYPDHVWAAWEAYMAAYDNDGEYDNEM